MVVAIGALYFGRDILIPFALAVLISFALAPLVRRLRNLRLGRVLSVVIAATLAFSLIGGIAVVIGSQLVQLASNLPDYQQNIQQKIKSLRPSTTGSGVVGRTATMIRELQSEVASQAGDEASDLAGSGQATQAVPVRIEEPELTAIDVIRTVAVPILSPFLTAGLVIVFVIFMLLERENLRDRFIALIGTRELHVTTEALDEAAVRVSRYLLMQLLVNATYGIPIGLGLWLIGVPNAVLWGLLATVLRFVPYVGPFIAAMFPLALAFAVDPGWSMLLWTIALVVTLELISNNVVEPWLYGASTGISAVAIIIAAIFWTTLWGPIGLFLSTPLTVCLAVIGRYVPALHFLDVLLGAAPVFEPPERLYQRMLAGDIFEAEQIAAAYLKEKSLLAFCDEVVLPALRLAERDRERGALSAERQAVVTESLLGLVRELADYEEPAAAAGDAAENVSRPPSVWSTEAVLCIGARSGLDTAAASLLAQVLSRRGIGTRVAPREVLSAEALGTFTAKGVEAICLIYLAASARTYARNHCRRLHSRLPHVRLLVGLWHPSATADGAEGSSDIPADAIVRDFAEMVAVVERCAYALAETPMTPAPIPPFETERLEALKRLNLDGKPIAALEAITRELAEAFDVPIALVSLVDEDHQRWPGACGLPPDLDAVREAPRETSICGHVVAADQPLVIEDALKDKRFANNPFLRERGIRFYAGVPLRTRSGLAIGSLCVIDTTPRTFSKSEQRLLCTLADKIMAELERETTERANDHDRCDRNVEHSYP
ncbi:MAG TPA: AI-2E family transporter [Candidatus Limnocylindrales bacterium]|nr:AI-2E family transporter [Candidatus Limnocylindrales bacterium]